jgi:hypothetical protein
MTARRPTFIIGGAPRAGTNYLLHALERHWDVCLARPYIPEPKVLIGPERPASEYFARYAELFRDAGARRALGEKTSTYFESEVCATRLRRHLPDVRLLFLLREPVARAYSNFLWSTKNGLETLPFEEAIRLEGHRPSPLPADKAHARPFDYLLRGRYDLFAQRYYDLFGRAQVAFFLYEEMVKDPERVLADIERFIGVEPIPLEADRLGLVNSAREVGPPIDPVFEHALRERMAPTVRRLQALTGLDLSVWGYDRLEA